MAGQCNQHAKPFRAVFAVDSRARSFAGGQILSTGGDAVATAGTPKRWQADMDTPPNGEARPPDKCSNGFFFAAAMEKLSRISRSHGPPILKISAESSGFDSLRRRACDLPKGLGITELING